MIRIVSLTEAGKVLGKNLLLLLGEQASHEYKPQPFKGKLQQWFNDGERLILIMATGIAVRTLAPVLTDKYHDPAVLVLDEQGKFIIPLLSGHQGGANAWANELSQLLSAQLVSTTAMSYVSPIYSVGLGCERNCPLEFIEALLEQALQQANLSIADISNLNSISLKGDEPALLALSDKLNKEFKVWSVEQLTTMEYLLVTPSDYVKKTVGVSGVAESAALYGVGNLTSNTPELIVSKIKNTKATCAIARSYRA